MSAHACRCVLLLAAILAATIALSACGPELATSPAPAPAARPDSDDSLSGKSITELQRDLDAGVVTSEALVHAYLHRIAAIDRHGPTLQSVLALNPDAVDQARALDVERHQKGSRGPLHGIPILLKDNIESADKLPTTAGSLALVDNMSGSDAPIVANLRAAGAIILGKTNLSEWANFRSDHSLSGWSALGGLTKNAHVLDRSACGSSAGSAVAVAAGFAAASVGTETDGSITCPAAMNGIVGLKPTVGLLSQQRIVPIAHSQDAAGPMALSVTDAAVMLSAMVGEKPACDSTIPGCRKADYVAALTSSALQGKRIGVLRFDSGRHPRVEPVYERALNHLRDAGATLVEVKLPDMSRIYDAEEAVLNTEFKADLNAYLAATPTAVKTRNLTALIGFNRDSPRELVLFGQETFLKADKTTGLEDASYKAALADSKRLAAQEGITRLLSAEHLDLLAAPTSGPAWRTDVVNGDHFSGSFSTLPAVAGFPHLTVPMGEIDHLPLGISFIGPAWSEDLLFAAGFAFEQRAKARIKPDFLPSIDQGTAAVAPD
jgi:amidase